jgi:hypothetical protein
MLHAVSLVRMSLLWPSLPPPMCIRLCVSPYPWDTTSPLSPAPLAVSQPPSRSRPLTLLCCPGTICGTRCPHPYCPLPGLEHTRGVRQPLALAPTWIMEHFLTKLSLSRARHLILISVSSRGLSLGRVSLLLLLLLCYPV